MEIPQVLCPTMAFLPIPNSPIAYPTTASVTILRSQHNTFNQIKWHSLQNLQSKKLRLTMKSCKILICVFFFFINDTSAMMNKFRFPGKIKRVSTPISKRT